jgi:hypothetical protein
MLKCRTPALNAFWVAAMDEALEKVRRAALEEAVATGTLQDIERAASVVKALAEAEKSASETRNARRQLSFQSITSLSAILVPVVSLLALVSTIYIQGQQLSETQQQNRTQLEDTQWRDFLTSLRGSPAVFDSDVTVAPRLRSFFNSVRYGDQARDISIRLMGRLTNAAGFKELYNIAFPVLTPDAFSKVLDVERALTATRNNVESECSNLSSKYDLPDDAAFGLCTMALSVSNLTKHMKSEFPPRALERRQADAGLMDDLTFISQNITSYLKQNYSVGHSEKAQKKTVLNLADTSFFNLDWSNIDLSGGDLQRAFLQNVNFTNSYLRTTKYTGVWFYASNWWDAQNIDQDLLDMLIEYQYPFFVQNVAFAPLPEPTIGHYRARIAELCQPPRPICRAENLKFGFAPENHK